MYIHVRFLDIYQQEDYITVIMNWNEVNQMMGFKAFENVRILIKWYVPGLSFITTQAVRNGLLWN